MKKKANPRVESFFRRHPEIRRTPLAEMFISALAGPAKRQRK